MKRKGPNSVYLYMGYPGLKKTQNSSWFVLLGSFVLETRKSREAKLPAARTKDKQTERIIDLPTIKSSYFNHQGKACISFIEWHDKSMYMPKLIPLIHFDHYNFYMSNTVCY